MHEPIEPSHHLIRRLVGVYNAQGTLRGEVAYWVGARLGRDHCGLCDITHGMFVEKKEWKHCRETLPVPFDLFHADDQPENVSALLGQQLPAVVAETESGLRLLLSPQQLTSCDGSPARLVDSLIAAASQLGLRWA